MQRLEDLITNRISEFYMPSLRVTDVVEILIIAFILYHLLNWVRNTRIWSLFKGLMVIVFFVAIAGVFNMTTIVWIVRNVALIAAVAMVVILQPELRKALELLGRRSFLSGAFSFFDNANEGRFSDKTLSEISRACSQMAKARTGALIVIEQSMPLTDVEQTGIEVDAVVSSQLLINIFEHNTPLHDGAVIVRGDRVVSATCYLPLSDNLELDKDLGTRHRAGVGVTELTDAFCVIVSEETGKISMAYAGELERAVDVDRLRERLRDIQMKPEESARKVRRWKGVA